MKSLSLTGATVLLVCAASSAAYAADAERGRVLYETHCIVCHTPRIHMRPNKLPLTREDLRILVDDFRRMENPAWTPEETEDVVEYLSRTRYHFAPAAR